VREDEDAARGSAVEMSGYAGGGMSKEDYAPTADLYQNMFDKTTAATKEYIARDAGEYKMPETEEE